ncbi:MAG: hypothetical protein M1816_005768, partial [Peltula sp. TS41687]
MAAMRTLATQHSPEPNPLDRTGLCLLSLDGGGVRGLSMLYLLKGLMDRLNHERQKDGLLRVKPCELFDLIGGTSTGGLIAIMLGRLEMDVVECIEAYSELMETVFRKKRSKLPISCMGKTKARFDSKKLKSAVEKVVTNHNASSTELFENGTTRGCRVFVCSIAHETKEIVRLRSYSLTDETGISATICQAALATSAATSYFDPVDIRARRFADGGLGANNPVDEVEGEASNIWCAETGDLKPLVKCFISIGTGNPGKKAIEDKVLGFLSRTLVGIATQTEETEKRFIAKWRQHFDEKRYFRFNVDQGLQDIGLAEYQQQGAIQAATDGYINHQAQKFRVRDCILNLKQKQNRTDTAFASIIYEFNARRVIGLQASELLNARKACWNVPFERNLSFVGRSSQLERLESTLFVSGRTQKTAIFGLGGVGKTQIALELAHRIREKYGDCSLLWVPATNVESLQQTYLNIGQQLGIPGLEGKQAEVYKLVQQYLSQKTAGQWLLIFDNADDVDMWIGSTSGRASLTDFLPQSSRGSIIFTTRSRKIAVHLARQNIVKVSEMDQETATQLLAKSLADPSLLGNHQDTAQLVEQLTFLPLAIAQAAAYINKNGIAFADYLSLLNDQEENVVDILSEDFKDEARYQDVKNPVATTWLISFNQIRRHDPLAAEYLSIMSCIDPKNIPQSLLPPAKSRKAEVDAIGTLDAYSFVSKQSIGLTLDIHRLVHLATRNWLAKEGSLASWEGKAVARLNEVFPSHDHENRRVWRAYLPHVQYISGFTLRVEDTNQGLGLCEKFGLCLLSDGRYSEAKKPLLKVKEGREKALGKEHPHTLTSVSNLALVLQDQGKYEAAEEMNWRALEGYEKALGKEHPDTLTSVSILALVLQHQGKYEAAEEMNRRALEGREKALGKEHPDTLTS